MSVIVNANNKYLTSEGAYIFEYTMPSYPIVEEGDDSKFTYYQSEIYEKDQTYVEEQTHLNLRSLSLNNAYCNKNMDGTYTIMGSHKFVDDALMAYKFYLTVSPNGAPVSLNMIFDASDLDKQYDPDLPAPLLIKDELTYTFHDVYEEPHVPYDAIAQTELRGYLVAEFENGMMSTYVDNPSANTIFMYGNKVVNKVSDAWFIQPMYYSDYDVQIGDQVQAKVMFYIPQTLSADLKDRVAVYGYAYDEVDNQVQVKKYDSTAIEDGVVTVENFTDYHIFLGV